MTTAGTGNGSRIPTTRSGEGAWRIARWTLAAAMFAAPWVAMQFSGEVDWGGMDFLVFGSMLAGVCGGYELALQMNGHRSYRAGAALALLGAFFLVWVTLAVGIIGSEHDPENMLFAGVLLIGLIGAVMARFRPEGMALAALATAIAQTLVVVLALVAGWDKAVLLTVIWVALWLACAGLFWRAAKEQAA